MGPSHEIVDGDVPCVVADCVSVACYEWVVERE